MSLEQLIQFKDKLEAQFSQLPEQYGYIVYIFDRSENGQGIGFHKNADFVDAAVAIERIMKQFDLY